MQEPAYDAFMPRLEAVLSAHPNGEPQAVQLERGEPLDPDRPYSGPTVRDGVAVLSISGPIFRRDSFFSWYYGGCNLNAFALNLGKALNDPSVKSILLEVDSPGGEALGCGEVAGMIFAAREHKPVIAYVTGMGASAAYYLASAATEVVIHKTAFVGSIGTVISFTDTSKLDEELGIQRVKIVSKVSPKKQLDPGTKDGRDELQKMVDSLAEAFVADVARFRSVSEEKVLSDFGQGGILMGEEAVSAGMADRTGNCEDLIKELAETGRSSYTSRFYSAHATADDTKGKAMSFWDKMKTLFQEAGIDPDAPNAGASTGTPAAVAPVAASPAAAVNPQPSAREKELEDQLTAERSQRIRTEAQAFADGEVAANRALPSESAAIVAQYLRAAEDDAANPVQAVSFALEAAEGNEPVKFEASSRVEAFKAGFSARTPHTLTQELAASEAPLGSVALPNKTETPGMDGKEKPMTAERQAELLAETPTGQAVLSAKKQPALSG